MRIGDTISVIADPGHPAGWQHEFGPATLMAGGPRDRQRERPRRPEHADEHLEVA